MPDARTLLSLCSQEEVVFAAVTLFGPEDKPDLQALKSLHKITSCFPPCVYRTFGLPRPKVGSKVVYFNSLICLINVPWASLTTTISLHKQFKKVLLTQTGVQGPPHWFTCCSHTCVSVLLSHQL